MEFIDFINKIIQNSKFAKGKNLTMRNFSIIPLSREVGLVEWVDNTTTIRPIIEDLWS